MSGRLGLNVTVSFVSYNDFNINDFTKHLDSSQDELSVITIVICIVTSHITILTLFEVGPQASNFSLEGGTAIILR